MFRAMVVMDVAQHEIRRLTHRWGFGFNIMPAQGAVVIEIWDKSNNRWMGGCYISDMEIQAQLGNARAVLLLVFRKATECLADAILLRAEKEGRV